METNGSGVGLTVRELVLEVRSDVKELKENSVSKVAFEEALDVVRLQDQRIVDLERSHIMLRGVWMTLTVAIAALAGTAGLVISSLNLV